MQRFPLKSERSNIASIRRNGGPDGSSTRKSPIDSPMTLNGMIKVLIIHHAPLVRSGLVALIEATGRFAVCGETDDAPTGREMFVKHQPRLVALGLTLRRGSGIELIKDFRTTRQGSSASCGLSTGRSIVDSTRVSRRDAWIFRVGR